MYKKPIKLENGKTKIEISKELIDKWDFTGFSSSTWKSER
jgi:hypothetical protein